METRDEIERLLSKGQLDLAIRQAEECWGPTPCLDDRIPVFRNFLSEEYDSYLAPASCRLVYLNFDDPSETLTEAGDMTIWVDLYEKTPTPEELDESGGGGSEFSIPVTNLEAAELTILYGMRMALGSMLQLRQEEHPVGSAELRVGYHAGGDDYRLLKKIRAFPCRFDFEARIAEVESALACQERANALRLLLRLPPNLKKKQGLIRDKLWNAATEPARTAQTLLSIAQAMEELRAVGPDPRLASLIRELHMRAGRLHAASKDYLAAMGEFYRVGQSPEEAILEAVGLSGSLRLIWNRPRPTYFHVDRSDPCSYGLVEIVEDRLERRQTTTLPLEVYRILEKSFDFFDAGQASESLTRAAFHAFQAGYLNHAAYLTRKAGELDPKNSVAQRSREALLGKGVSETGSERDCLETILTDRVSAHNGLKG